MNKMKSIVQRSVLPATLALSLLAHPFDARATAAPDTNTASADPIVATGKGFEIKRSQLDDAYVDYTTSVASRGGTVPEAQRAEIRSNLLDHLVINQILLQKVLPEDRAKTLEAVNNEIAAARSNAPSPEAFEAHLKARGITLDQVRNKEMEGQLVWNVILRDNTNDISVTDADVKKFYDDHPSEFEVPEEVHAAHILVSTLDPVTQAPLPDDQKKAKERLAKELRDRALKGEDFAALAKQYSDDPGSKARGGDYTFPRGKMVPEFEAAAFSLQTNQISDLVETRFGYHIIKLLAKIPASKIPLSEAAPKIRAYLVNQAVKNKLPEYTARVKAAADIKILDAGVSTPVADKK
jgi:parvulin-like peptidyl-prolyl isomerase